MEVDSDLHYDFTHLLHATRETLMIDLAEVHSSLANLSIRISFLKAEEARGVAGAKPQRLEFEGLREAYSEKKWLIKVLLDG